jgi:hypothetical protein
VPFQKRTGRQKLPPLFARGNDPAQVIFEALALPGREGSLEDGYLFHAVETEVAKIGA